MSVDTEREVKRWIVYVDVEIEAPTANEAERIAMSCISGHSLEWSVSDVAEID